MPYELPTYELTVCSGRGNKVTKIAASQDNDMQLSLNRVPVKGRLVKLFVAHCYELAFARIEQVSLGHCRHVRHLDTEQRYCNSSVAGVSDHDQT